MAAVVSPRGLGSEEDQEEDGEEEKQKVVVKVGMVGDAQIGESALPSRRPACTRAARRAHRDDCI